MRTMEENGTGSRPAPYSASPNDLAAGACPLSGPSRAASAERGTGTFAALLASRQTKPRRRRIGGAGCQERHMARRSLSEVRSPSPCNQGHSRRSKSIDCDVGPYSAASRHKRLVVLVGHREEEGEYQGQSDISS